MVALAAVLLAWGVQQQPLVLHVSPNGNDKWQGTSRQPFRTLTRARDAARTLRRDDAKPVTIWLEKGTYELTEPFKLEPKDSHTLYRGRGAMVSGGRSISGFHVDSHGWWRVNLPEFKSGNWRFEQLFVNGQRRYRPRLPKQGYYNIAGEQPPTDAARGHGFDRFGFSPGDINKAWSNLSDIELLCFHVWDMSRMRIGSVDQSGNIVTTTAPTGYDADWAKFPKGNRFIVENVKEALSDPGEWYADTKSGDLTYIPMKGETIQNSVVVAPVAERLVDISGDLPAKKFVEEVNFEGIRFAYSNWNLPAGGRFFPQAEVDLSAAIHATGWRNSRMQNCEVEHVGEYGIEFGRDCQNVAASHCQFIDLGAGGVKIGETMLLDDEKDSAQSISIEGCEIRAGGRLHPAAIGIWVGQSAHNHVVNNTICDLYYTGISLGWTWGYGKSQAHDNDVEFNHIFDIGQGVLSDMGGIYTLGMQPGTKLIGNRIHDIDSFSYGGWGIYPDEGSSTELIDSNVVFRTKSGGFHQHYGRENVVRNNIFAFAREAEVIRTRAEDHLSFTFENNIVFWKDAPLLGSNWSGNNYKLDRNVFWRTDSKPIDFAGMSSDQWHAHGQDVHSIIADPMFENPDKDDFRLKPSSPALKLGFRRMHGPVDTSAPLPTKGKVTNQAPAFPVGPHHA